MPDNLPALPTGPFALPGHRVLALEGRDAATFAQAQFMSDVAALADGHWHWSGWLTPKGRVVALFALLRLDAERLWLVLPDADPAALAAQLQRFVFRAKVNLAVHEDLAVSGAFAPPTAARGNVMAGDATEGIELDHGGDGGPRTLRVAPGTATPGHAEAEAQWRVADLAHGLPRLGPEQSEQWTPQMLSLDRLQAFSIRKGCYPGQEIVARTHFLGQAKRGLVLLAGDAPIAPATDVVADGRALGRVASAAGHLALAVLPAGALPAPLQAGDADVAVQPLLGGLAR